MLKIKLILSGLILQACFFSTSSIAASYYAASYNGGTYNWVSSYTSACSEGISNYYSIYNYVKYADYNEPPSTCATVHTPTVQYYIPVSVFKVTCGTDYAPTTSSTSCTYVAPKDCSGMTGSLIITSSDGDTSSLVGDTYDRGGCEYTSIFTYCNDSFCVNEISGTGNVSALGTLASPTPPIQTPENNFSFIDFPIATALWDAISDTIINADGSVTDTLVTTTSDTNNSSTSILSDGTNIVVTENYGTTSGNLETSVTNTFADNSSVNTTSSISTNTSGSVKITTTQASTGSSTSSTSPPVVSQTTKTTTTNRDASGAVTNRTVTDGKGVKAIDNPNATDCGYADYPPCKLNEDGTPDGKGQNSLTDGTAGKGLSDFDTFITGVSTAPNLTPLSFSLPLPSHSSCKTISITIKGAPLVFPSPAQCVKLESAKEMIGWLIYIFTIYMLFSIAVNSGTKV